MQLKHVKGIEKMASDKQLLRRWVGWFFFVNILLSLLIQTSYLLVMPSLSAVAGATNVNLGFTYFFLGVSYIAHASILNGVLAAIVWVVSWLTQRRNVIMPLAVILALTLLIAQVIDRFAYRLYHAHQFAVGISVLKSGAVGEVMPLSQLEYWFLVLIITVIVIAELVVASLVWRRLKSTLSIDTPSLLGVRITQVLVFCTVLSYGMMALVITVPLKYRLDQTQSHLLLKVARLIPYYQTVYSWIMPHSTVTERTWLVDNQHVTVPTQQSNQPLNYPLHPLRCTPPQKKPNIIFLVFDTLRYDSLTSEIMPHMAEFAKHTVQFDHVYSGGNCTQPGVFSLFYGIPANYWEATVEQHKGPVLIDALQQAGYQMGIFASASLLFPQFEDNVFVNVKKYNTETPGDTSKARDAKITQLFGHFLQQRNSSKPFFSFIFYDSVHNYCEGSGKEFMAPFKPAIAECARFSLTKNTPRMPYINRYNNAAHYLDDQAGQVLAMLRQHHLLKNTIVVITADHGEQHNDQGMDYWSHASAYTPYQLHIPMLVYWPGMKPQHRRYFATNFDVVPTLMKQVLNCKNPEADYTVGESLFNTTSRPYLISGSYTDYAYVTPQQTIRVYPGGDYIINGPLGHHQYRARLNIPLLQQATTELNRYFRHG